MAGGKLDVMASEDALVRVIRIFAARGRAIREARERENLIGSAATAASDPTAKSDSPDAASPFVTIHADNSVIGRMQTDPEEETES